MKSEKKLTSHPDEEIVCWTKMQAVAGEPLDFIIFRKEHERERTEDGTFFWGVGNSPGKAREKIMAAKVPIPIIFSIQLARPQKKDMSPDSNRVFVWKAYINSKKKKEFLPEGVLVTSRREPYYALKCQLKDPLRLCYGKPFDPSAFKNVGTNKPLGASQVTSLIRRVRTDGGGNQDLFPSYLFRYRVNLKARLLDWVELTEPVQEDIRDVHRKSKSYERYMADLRFQGN